EPRIALEAKIQIENTPITVFTTHLAYSYAFQDSTMRNMQVDNLLTLLPKTNTILMGDFNAHPDSSYMKKLTQVMSNTDTESFEPTWTIYPFSYEGFEETQLRHRLDYIFASRDLRHSSCKIENSKASDLLPISIVLKL